MLQYKNCALCGQDKTEVFKKINDFTIVRCTNDGLVYVNPQPSELKDFYNENYFCIEKKFGGKALKIDAKKLLKNIPAGTLLDIGCSYGFLLEAARELGFKAYGVDISQDCIDQCAQNGFIVKKSYDYPDNFFDVVTLIGSIDHLQNLSEDFKEIQRITRPNAKIIIRVGDMNLFPASYTTVKPPEHLYYFSGETVKKFLEHNNFSNVNIKRSFVSFTLAELNFRIFRLFFRFSNWGIWPNIQKAILGILKFLKIDKFIVKIPDGQVNISAQKVN